MGLLTIVIFTFSIIGVCSALPISLPTEQIATQWLIGSVFMLGAALITVGGCLCCKRKKGFKEFNNEPGLASHTVSAESPFPIFRPLTQAQPTQSTNNENQSEITPLNHPESPILPHNNIAVSSPGLIDQFSNDEPIAVDNLEPIISPERVNNFETPPRQHISPINNLASIRNNMQIISNAIINIVTHDQIEIDNNNGPISELDIQNIANNNAEGYIRNQNEIYENQNLEVRNEDVAQNLVVSDNVVVENYEDRNIYEPSTSSGILNTASPNFSGVKINHFGDGDASKPKLDTEGSSNESFLRELSLSDIPQSRNLVENKILDENVISIGSISRESPKLDDKSTVDDVNEALRVLESVLSGESDCDSASCSSLGEIQLDFSNDDIKICETSENLVGQMTDFENVAQENAILDIGKTQDMDRNCVINLGIENNKDGFGKAENLDNIGKRDSLLRVFDGPMSDSCIVNFDESEIQKLNDTNLDVTENEEKQNVIDGVQMENLIPDDLKVDEIKDNSAPLVNSTSNKKEENENEFVQEKCPVEELSKMYTEETEVIDIPKSDVIENNSDNSSQEPVQKIQQNIERLEIKPSENSLEVIETETKSESADISDKKNLNGTFNKEKIDNKLVVREEEIPNSENIPDNFLDDIATSDAKINQLQNSGFDQTPTNRHTKSENSETVPSTISKEEPISKVLSSPEKNFNIDTKTIEVLESLNIKTSTPSKNQPEISENNSAAISIRNELLQKQLTFNESPKKPNYDFLKSGQINLESWDKFLGDSFERSTEENDFEFDNLDDLHNNQNKLANNTYTKESTSVGDIADITGDEFFYIPQDENPESYDDFENGFQNKENVRNFRNESTFSSKDFDSDSDLRFHNSGNEDDENLAEIRRALIMSLPDAQGPKTKEICNNIESGTKSAQNTPDNVQAQKRNILGILEDGFGLASHSFHFPEYFINEGNTEERNEVYIRYNAAGPLSPILEDWLGEGTDENSNGEISNVASDELKISSSSESAGRTFIINENQPGGDSTSCSDRSTITSDKPRQILGSWCSNDTLFNVEDTLDIEKISSPAENNEDLVQKTDFPNCDIDENSLKEDQIPNQEIAQQEKVVASEIDDKLNGDNNDESQILEKSHDVDVKEDEVIFIPGNNENKNNSIDENLVLHVEECFSKMKKYEKWDDLEKILNESSEMEIRNDFESNSISLNNEDDPVQNLDKTSEDEPEIVIENSIGDQKLVTEIQIDKNTLQNRRDDSIKIVSSPLIENGENLDITDFSKVNICENISEIFSKIETPLIMNEPNQILDMPENSTKTPVEIQICKTEILHNQANVFEVEILAKDPTNISKIDQMSQDIIQDFSDKENDCEFSNNKIKKINHDFLSNEKKYANTKFLKNSFSGVEHFLDKTLDTSNKKYLVKKSDTKINFFPMEEGKENFDMGNMKICENLEKLNGDYNTNEDDSSSEHENEDTISSNTDDYDTLTSSSQSGQEYELQGEIMEDDEKICALNLEENSNSNKNILNLDGENDPWTSNLKFSENDLMTTSFSSESPMISPQSAECVQSKFAENQNQNLVNFDDDTVWESEDTSGEFEWKSGDQENLENTKNPTIKVDQILEDGTMQTVTEIEEDENDLVIEEEESPVDSAKASTEDLEKEEENDEYDTNSSSDESEEIEFIPSTWNSLAAPARSSLKSPENSTADKKGRSVVFKKEKYMSVYEYPREQEHCTYIEPMYDNSLSYTPNGPVLCFDRFFVTSTTLPFNEYEFYPTNSDTSKDFDTNEQFNWLNEQSSSDNPFDSEDVLNSITDFDLQGTLDTEYKVGDDQFSLDPMPENDRLYEFTDQSLDEFDQEANGTPWSHTNEEVTSFMSPDTPDSNNSQINSKFKTEVPKMSDFATPDSGIEVTPNPENFNKSIKFSEITTIDCSEFTKDDTQNSNIFSEKLKENKEFNNIDNLGMLCHTKSFLKLPLKLQDVNKDSSESLDLGIGSQELVDIKDTPISTNGKNNFEENDERDLEINEQDSGTSVDEFENTLNVLKQVLDCTKTNDKIQSDLLLSDVGSANSGDEDSGIDSATTLIDINNRS